MHVLLRTRIVIRIVLQLLQRQMYVSKHAKYLCVTLRFVRHTQIAIAHMHEELAIATYIAS